jgi:hypothetical protein
MLTLNVKKRKLERGSCAPELRRTSFPRGWDPPHGNWALIESSRDSEVRWLCSWLEYLSTRRDAVDMYCGGDPRNIPIGSGGKHAIAQSRGEETKMVKGSVGELPSDLRSSILSYTLPQHSHQQETSTGTKLGLKPSLPMTKALRPCQFKAILPFHGSL